MDLGKFQQTPPPPPTLVFFSKIVEIDEFSSFCLSFALLFWNVHFVVLVCLPASTHDWSALGPKVPCSLCPARSGLLNWPCLTCPAQLSEPHTRFGRLSYQLVADIGNVTKRMSSHNNIHQLTYSSISTNSHKHSTSMLLTITKPQQPCQLMTSNWVTVTTYSGLSMLLCVCSLAYSALHILP